MTRKQLAERVGLTLDGIKYHMRRLKASGAIVRVGSSRAGHWQVLEPGISGSARKQPENNQKPAGPDPEGPR
ncbi:winged helix-turn-helix domain-containing protein [Candidatus Palauibacter sp.]